MKIKTALLIVPIYLFGCSSSVQMKTDKNDLQLEISVLGEEPESIEFKFNGNKQSLQAQSMFFVKIEDGNEDIVEHNGINSILVQKQGLKEIHLFKEESDFAGNTWDIILVDRKKEQAYILGSIQRDFVEIKNDTTIVFKTLSFEPGWENGIEFIDYPVFEVYKIRNLVVHDKDESLKYNLKNDTQYLNYLKMEKPVLGRPIDSLIDYKLMDLKGTK